MPKLTGIFSDLKDLDKLPVEEVESLLKGKIEPHRVDNFIGNRLLYPQTISDSKWDLEFDYSLLRAYLKSHPEFFYDLNTKKIVISVDIIKRLPPVLRLVTLIVDAIAPMGATTVLAKDDGKTEVLGTVIKLGFLPADPQVSVVVDEKVFTLKIGGISRITTDKKQLKVTLGVQETFTVAGGEIGLIFDLRRT